MQSTAYLQCEESKTPLPQEQISIGRLNSNRIQVNDPTVSKCHLTIAYRRPQDTYFVKDHNTINGTYLNGRRLQPNEWLPLTHKDSIQLGKHPHLYLFCRNNPAGKRKINLKDYCQELEEQEERKVNKDEGKVNKDEGKVGEQHKNTQRMSEIKRKKLKIPDLSQYLELEQSLSEVREPGKEQRSRKEEGRRVPLPQLQSQFTPEEREQLRLQQKEKNIYLLEQEAKRMQEQEGRSLQTQKIALQLEKQRQEEQMLRKRLEMEEYLRAETQKIQEERDRLEREHLERRERDARAWKEEQERQAREAQSRRLEETKELQQFKRRELGARETHQASLKRELRGQFEQRKKQLELEAEGLTRHYEQVYRDTLDKMRRDIQTEQAIAHEAEHQLREAKQREQKESHEMKEIEANLSAGRAEYRQVLSRNKAILMYASELQDWLDSKAKQRSPNTSKLSQEVGDCRRLLHIRDRESQQLGERIERIQRSSHLANSILETHSQVQSNKQVFFQYLERERGLEAVWEEELAHHEAVLERNRNIQREITATRIQLLESLKEHANKTTQEHLQIFRLLHQLPEPKREAVRVLIDELGQHAQETHQLSADSQAVHQAIHSLIVRIEQLKTDNDYLSQLLFADEPTLHHFDNLKQTITALQSSLQSVHSQIPQQLYTLAEAHRLQVSIHSLTARAEQLRLNLKEQARHSEDDILNFFGDKLNEVETENEELRREIHRAEEGLKSSTQQYKETEGRKKAMQEQLDRLRREELKWIKNNK